MSAAQLSPANVRAFILGGNATVTLQSGTTGARFTFKVRASDDGGTYFVALLTGSDNEGDFAYLGTIRADRYTHGRKSKIGADAPAARAFAWAWGHIAADNIPAALQVYHEGRCGRCNRKLTVPESIESGFGPECSGKRARVAVAA
jgi:uncharacterized protein DUF6011